MNYQTLIFAFLFLSMQLFAQKGQVAFRDLDVNHGLLFQPNTMKPFSGTARDFYAKGEKRLEVSIKEGKIDGKVKEWARNGKKVSESNYVAGVQSGMETQWYASGQKKLEINYVNGAPEGVCIEWFKNGAKKSEGYFTNGKENGEHRWWYNDGSKDQVVTYINGQADGIVRHWRQNGQLKLESGYQKGMLHGKTTEWHNNKQMIMTGLYHEGKEDGEFKYWSKKGVLLGVQTYDKGRLIKDLNYRSGNVRTQSGFVQVFNEKESHFSVAIEGEDVVPQQSKEDIVFLVDGQFLQLFNTPTTIFNAEEIANLSEEQLLEKYMAFEIQYIKEQTKADIEVQSEIRTNNEGKRYLYWHFTAPVLKNAIQSTRRVVEEHYISFLCNRQFLNLYSLDTEQDLPGNGEKLLKRIADQLQEQKTPIDLNSFVRP